MKVVFDSSTLILLAKIYLLREVSEDVEVIIPEAVKKECLVKKTLDAELISLLIRERKIQVHKVDNAGAIKKIRLDFRIERGEAEALWLARKYKCPLAVDDGPTIRACKIMALEFLTAIHFLLSFASGKKLPTSLAQEKLEKLFRYGRYNKRIIEDALKHLKGV